MRIPVFELERFQSLWEHKVPLNVAESGVHPMDLDELFDGDSLRDALGAVRLGYPQTNGSIELRERIASLYPGAGPQNVLVTTGCAEANFLTAWALLEQGDESVVMQPNYMQLAGLAEAFGGSVKPWWLQEQLAWAPDLDELPGLIGPRTKMVAICNPNNPTGAVLEEERMNAIAAAAAEHGAWLLADEVYRGAELDGRLTPTFYGRVERVVCTGGLSKGWGLPGLRIGWAVGPADLVERLWSHKDYTTIGPTVLSDRIATLALAPERRQRILDRTRGILRGNYPIVRDWVASHEGRLTHHPPRAGAIAWIGCPQGPGPAEMAQDLLKNDGVLILPGSYFGMDRYIRVGFGGDPEQLRETLDYVSVAMRGDRT